MNTGPEPESNQLAHQETLEEAQPAGQESLSASEPVPAIWRGRGVLLAAVGGGFLGAVIALGGIYLISRESAGWLNSGDSETRQQLDDLRYRYKQLESALRQQP